VGLERIRCLAYNPFVNRGLIYVLLVCLIGLAISYPAIERVDSWDHFAQTGNETELNVLCTLSMLGVIVLLGLGARLVSLFALVGFALPERIGLVHARFVSTDLLTASPPPLPLRI
jgi:hypothetical protein